MTSFYINILLIKGGFSTYGSVHFGSRFLAFLYLDILKLERMNDYILVDNLFYISKCKLASKLLTIELVVLT